MRLIPTKAMPGRGKKGHVPLPRRLWRGTFGREPQWLQLLRHGCIAPSPFTQLRCCISFLLSGV